MGAMEVETKFLRVFRPLAIGDRIDGWRVCWIGGRDKCRVPFVVTVDRPLARISHRHHQQLERGEGK